MGNYVDFDLEVSKQLKRNIEEVHESLKSRSMQLKINNYAIKYELEPNYVEQLIVDDVNFAMIFAKDPGRQSIHEKISADHIANLDVVKSNGSFTSLPGSGKNALYITTNGVRGENEDGNKSIDFKIEVGDELIYATCKYTKDEGGSQDNQYADVREYVGSVVVMMSRGNIKDNEHFIVIVDGEYYERKGRKEELMQIGLGRVPILSINDVNKYLSQFD